MVEVGYLISPSVWCFWLLKAFFLNAALGVYTVYIVPRTGLAQTCKRTKTQSPPNYGTTYGLYCPQDRAGTDVQTHRSAT